MLDVIVIGAGPSGLTASIYLKRAGLNVLVLDYAGYGGKIINASLVENYPGMPNIKGMTLGTDMYNQAKDLGVKFSFEKCLSIDSLDDYKIVKTTSNEYKTKTIIIATGSTNRKLGLNNEKELTGKGVSYCATCDGNFYKNKVVAIVGGGNTAIEDALYLSNIASKVYLIHRRDEFRGENILVNKIKNTSNINLILNSNVTSINGTDKLESIDIIDKDENKTNIKIDGLFIAIGEVPNVKRLTDKLKLDNSGYIITDDKCHTNIDGIYAAGDVRSKNLRQLVTATSDGAIAAMEAVKYIK